MPSTRRLWLLVVVLLAGPLGSHGDARLRAAEMPTVPPGRVMLGIQVQTAGPCPGVPPQQGGGACVLGIKPASAADRAGLRAGDLILRINQTPVADGTGLVAATQTLRIGQSVEIVYTRATETRQVAVLIEAGDWILPTAETPVSPLPPVQSDSCDDTMNASPTLMSPPYRKQRLTMDRDAVERLLGPESSVIALNGDVLVLAFRGTGASARVVGSIQCALDRVDNADVWALQLRMQQWEQTYLSAQFMAMKSGSRDPTVAGSATTTAQATFRGSGAPRAPAAAQPLRGTLATAMVPSRFLGAAREVSLYLPPGPATVPLPVLYMTDGQGLTAFAAITEALIESGSIRPIAIVAEHAGRYTGDSSKPYDPRLDDRAREYLPVVDPPQFARHMQFFMEELLPWAEKQYGLSAARSDRAAMGYSNGGAFVAQLGVQHPEAFATILPFSPAYQISFNGELRSDPARLPRFLFAAGELEAPFLASARGDSAWLDARGVSTALRAYWSGHDTLMWQQALAEYLPGVFAARE